MSDRTAVLARVVEAERAALSASLDSLEERMEKLTDWRHAVRTYTGPALSLAFGAGIVLAAATRGSTRRDGEIASGESSPRRLRRTSEGHRNDWVREIASTAVGIAGTYLMRYVTGVLAKESERDRSPT